MELPVMWGGVAISWVLLPHYCPPTCQEHCHHCCLLCASCGAAGDYLPDGEKVGLAPLAPQLQAPLRQSLGLCPKCRASQPGALEQAQVLGHQPWVQIPTFTSWVTLSKSLNLPEHQLFHLQSGGSTASVMVPSPSCYGDSLK